MDSDNLPEIDMDVHFMRMAFREAQTAAEMGEVPIGAVIVNHSEIVGKAHNQVEMLKDPTAHAEMIALTQASVAYDNWRLENAVLYVTKEPCPMCAGAIVQSRVKRVVWGLTDPLRGGAISLFNILQNDALNHRCEVVTGVMEYECKQLLQEFFQERRT
ncbi:MAG: tRNA(adenine34) deaminase [Kiritimatiellia bacterium]|jgi:tRNA(adenine34) deaminase